ncbi:hypothetical protein CIL05_18170 [Virgibacillus profundi]|uniref:Uncharacterized protein n=1 Tax=Virgibacillus profundi TaxID=2024555 RepID=A0A2A2I8K1_9BACI|nr:hypothetical protein [Virgibacillus profundi]PAV28039.1 hypothetical protein CIL05_18170 [Virgibacillus profundi]PXY52343.1 hypothetical protein CIT14_17615 [Virgibacillus profundi]
MNKTKNKSIFVPIFLVIFLNAALLDLKYKGLFYRLLPSSIQSYSDTILGKPDASSHHDEM